MPQYADETRRQRHILEARMRIKELKKAIRSNKIKIGELEAEIERLSDTKIKERQGIFRPSD